MTEAFGEFALLGDKKSWIRQTLLSRRRGLPEEQVQQKSKLIIDRLRRFPLYQRAEVIHCYLSVPKLGEVDTHDLIKQALKNGKRVVVPVTDFKRRVIKHSEIKSFEELEQKPSGLKEPKRGYLRPIDLKLIDLVILPCVAIDPQGNRIGMGGGFYDRFLSDLHALSRLPPTVVLAYEFQMVDRIETGPKDVGVEWIITEEKIYSPHNSQDRLEL
ncbi:MAG: 5-formyltetrahydrofolate cyclo-ligase [Candidatus Latescibacteria bacterium 4484_181]|nr:MAG: 5-formyltetrahydrofolate cyclo-ligase [Candidatus Latescibacteria bacterium 4484_181]RKY68600.1 MAG: 5-formyltetrahydrofolate cyclo-ligase [Candidatus Latescibacterota bacterium]RKY74090.1 MAG: 5-formyltetrahydrofolate cyclo-ligase [Candidatus Latescibacterota bacterium]HDN67904.1 5-formyltetrahydrofolate cyclo-ligase [Bacillota bacterium]